MNIYHTCTSNRVALVDGSVNYNGKAGKEREFHSMSVGMMII